MHNQKKLEVMNRFNQALTRQVFAHHPDCDEYEHHIIKFRDWSICIGCLGVYPTIAIMIMLTTFGYLLLPIYGRLWMGLVFFTPALVQIFWKSERKLIKYSMRVSLGISTFYLTSFIYYFPSIIGKILYFLIFLSGVLVYSRFQGKTQFRECYSCPHNFKYENCINKFDYILDIENLELISDVSDKIHYFTKLKQLRDIGDRMIKINEDV